MKSLSIITLFITSFLVISCKKNSISENCTNLSCNIDKPAGTYKGYPPPGPLWTSFTSQQQKLDACQIPQNILDTMKTEVLLQSCLDFPLLGDLLLNVGSNVPGITNFYMKNFSGLIELSKRKDAGTNMLERYLKMNSDCIDCLSDGVVKDHFPSSFAAFEMLMGQDSIIHKLSISEKKKLTKEAILKYNAKRKKPQYYAYYSLTTPLYVIAKLMVDENYIPFIDELNKDRSLQIFVEKLHWTSKEETDMIFQKIIDLGTKFSN